MAVKTTEQQAQAIYKAAHDHLDMMNGPEISAHMVVSIGRYVEEYGTLRAYERLSEYAEIMRQRLAN